MTGAHFVGAAQWISSQGERAFQEVSQKRQKQKNKLTLKRQSPLVTVLITMGAQGGSEMTWQSRQREEVEVDGWFNETSDQRQKDRCSVPGWQSKLLFLEKWSNFPPERHLICPITRFECHLVSMQRAVNLHSGLKTLTLKRFLFVFMLYFSARKCLKQVSCSETSTAEWLWLITWSELSLIS